MPESPSTTPSACDSPLGSGRPRRLFRPWLLALILIAGAIGIFFAQQYRESLRPKPAPDDIQRQGIEIVRGILAKIQTTPFGQSQRGQLLATQIESFLRRGSLLFSADISSQALYRREPLGFEALYVKLFRLASRWVHQDPELIAEGIFHEAVHALKSAYGGSSIEEECDGFAAGLAAGAAVTGKTLPEALTLDGMPAAEFVRRAYPTAPAAPTTSPSASPATGSCGEPASSEPPAPPNESGVVPPHSKAPNGFAAGRGPNSDHPRAAHRRSAGSLYASYSPRSPRSGARSPDPEVWSIYILAEPGTITNVRL
jgi:hypothetical protein